jgi:hypothetical protein
MRRQAEETGARQTSPHLKRSAMGRARSDVQIERPKTLPVEYYCSLTAYYTAHAPSLTRSIPVRIRSWHGSVEMPAARDDIHDRQSSLPASAYGQCQNHRCAKAGSDDCAASGTDAPGFDTSTTARSRIGDRNRGGLAALKKTGGVPGARLSLQPGFGKVSLSRVCHPQTYRRRLSRRLFLIHCQCSATRCVPSAKAAGRMVPKDPMRATDADAVKVRLPRRT